MGWWAGQLSAEPRVVLQRRLFLKGLAVESLQAETQLAELTAEEPSRSATSQPAFAGGLSRDLLAAGSAAKVSLNQLHKDYCPPGHPYFLLPAASAEPSARCT